MQILNELFFIKNTYEYSEFCNIKINFFNINILIKYFIFILFIIFIIFFNYVHIKIYGKISIEINNNIEIPEYENNKNYSYYNKEIKAIAFYYPEFIYDRKYNYYFKYNNSKNNKNGKKNISTNKIELLSKLIKKQIDLAKSHGIDGFAIYFKFDNCLEIIVILEKLAKDFYIPFFK